MQRSSRRDEVAVVAIPLAVVELRMYLWFLANGDGKIILNIESAGVKSVESIKPATLAGTSRLGRRAKRAPPRCWWHVRRLRSERELGRETFCESSLDGGSHWTEGMWAWEDEEKLEMRSDPGKDSMKAGFQSQRRRHLQLPLHRRHARAADLSCWPVYSHLT